eukprot:1884109-Alexandrium_andersonii.AAC.1
MPPESPARRKESCRGSLSGQGLHSRSHAAPAAVGIPQARRKGPSAAPGKRRAAPGPECSGLST